MSIWGRIPILSNWGRIPILRSKTRALTLISRALTPIAIASWQKMNWGLTPIVLAR